MSLMLMRTNICIYKEIYYTVIGIIYNIPLMNCDDSDDDDDKDDDDDDDDDDGNDDDDDDDDDGDDDDTNVLRVPLFWFVFEGYVNDSRVLCNYFTPPLHGCFTVTEVTIWLRQYQRNGRKIYG